MRCFVAYWPPLRFISFLFAAFCNLYSIDYQFVMIRIDTCSPILFACRRRGETKC